MPDADPWKRCSTCKKPIDFGSTYYVCSVSTCNKKRGGFFFCSVDCWEAHLPMMRHREAWAVEEKAPTAQEWAAQTQDDASSPAKPKASAQPASPRSSAPSVRRRVVGSSEPSRADAPRSDAQKDVLVVVSRLKQYVKARFDMNTSDTVLDSLSDEVRRLCDRAARNAREDGRKTILARDFDFLGRSDG